MRNGIIKGLFKSTSMFNYVSEARIILIHEYWICASQRGIDGNFSMSFLGQLNERSSVPIIMSWN